MLLDNVWIVLVAASLIGSASARMEHRSIKHLHTKKGQSTTLTTSNFTLPWGDDPKQLVKRDGGKYVFMHHIVGNTYPYTTSDWEKDIREIQAKGVDAVALNIGSSDWQRERVAQAYAAAASIGSNLKLFYSFDFTEMSCNLDDIVARINLFANHPNQFKVNGKVFVSSYSGDCLRNDGWASLKARTNAYVMPFIWGLENQFNSWNSLDSWYCWGCAYPQGNWDKSTDDDRYYMNQLGSRYAATISAWQFTHFPYKNWYLRGDNWLLNNRWEQLISMRNELTFIELLTWNDFGEGNYFGPIRGAQPSGTYWADNFPHTAWFDMSEYYIKAFKTGSYPAIKEDTIYFWSKPHPARAIASSDSVGRNAIGGPGSFDWAEDFLWAVTFTTAPAQVTLKMGGSQQTFSVNAGVTKLKLPSAEGKITVQMSRSGQTIINQTPAGFTYINNPTKYNLNAWVGSATATSVPDPGTSTSTTTTTSTSTTTSSTPTPTTTSVAGSTWTYQGCYDDPTSNRVLQPYSVSDGSMSISKCLTACSNEGFMLGGVEYGRECYCGQQLRSGSVAKADSECNMSCLGNGNELCGAGNRIALYSRPTPTGTTPTPTPITTSVAGSTWTYRGCYPDAGDRRTLYDGGSTSTSSNTVSQCLASCASKGFAFGGVEYGIECFCGSTIRSGISAVYASECSQTCAGNSNELCGAGNRIGIYERTTPSGGGGTTTTTTTTTDPTPSPTASLTVSTFSAKGCVAEGTTGSRRALTGASYSRSDMTPQVCNSLCSSFQYSGVENGYECYCGNSLNNNGATGAVIADSSCAAPCSGDGSQHCGGGWTMNVYQKTTATFSALGCYVDGSERMLRGYSTSSTSMTTDKCLGICLERGFKLAATQDGRECYCDNQIYKTGSTGSLTAAGECSAKCTGNSAQTCGAGWRNQLYSRP